MNVNPRRDYPLNAPWRYRLCHSIMMIPIVGSLWLLFPTFICLHRSSPTLLLVIAGVVIGLSFFSTILASFLTPIPIVASIFFLGRIDERVIIPYLIFVLLGMTIWSHHIITIYRLMIGEYAHSLVTHQLIVNQNQEVLHYRRRNSIGFTSFISVLTILIVLLSGVVGFTILSDDITIIYRSESAAVSSKRPTNTTNTTASKITTATPKPTKNVTATPKPTKRVTATPKVTQSPVPNPAYNGRIVVIPSYERVCPLTVNTAMGSGYYYIFLDYISTPSFTVEQRQRLKYASPPYEGDIAFLVQAGQSVSIDVPIGIYKMYYATGNTFYGPKYLFGDKTSCYEADSLFTFNATSGYYNGHTLTLYPVVGGNLETDEISPSKFPTK